MTVHHAAVLGSPIAHSLSPALHRAAYAALGLHWTYDAIEVDEAGLAGFLASLDESWVGLSLTRPLKSAVIPLLSEVDEVARSVGAINTVLPSPHGWRGTNTDISGVVDAVSRVQSRAPVTATVLGAGATSRSVLAALAELGVTHVTVCARRLEAARECSSLAMSLGMNAQAADLSPQAALIDVDVVASTLPGDVASPWSHVLAGATGTLLDASYHPWPTPLAAAWPNAAIASGRDMLLWQAVEQVRLMTGLEPPVQAMSAALPE